MFLMHDGDVMVLGGDITNTNAQQMFKLWSLEEQTVWRYAQFPFYVNGSHNPYWSATTDGRYIYMFGGHIAPHNAFYRIDTKNNYSIEILPPPLEFTAATNFGGYGDIQYYKGKIYKCGGNVARFNKNMYVYDIDSKKWSQSESVCPFEWTGAQVPLLTESGIFHQM